MNMSLITPNPNNGGNWLLIAMSSIKIHRGKKKIKNGTKWSFLSQWVCKNVPNEVLNMP